jgi:hypothetical protein
MPLIRRPILTLTTVGANTTIDIAYLVEFSVFERRLASLGLIFQEQADVIGVDDLLGQPPSFTLLATFPNTNLTVTDGDVPQTIERNISMTVPRASLQEDPAPALGNSDEIRGRVRIASIGIPPGVTRDALTNMEILLG